MRRMQGWAVAGLILVLGLGSVRGAAGQGLSNYDYEDLALRGIGFDVGYIWPDIIQDTPAYGIRVDLGYLGPGIRILPRVGYWSTSMTQEEVAKLERRVSKLVGDQNPLAPPLAVDLGVIDWSGVTLGTDAQLVWRIPWDVLTYAGLGVAAHFQNGSGASIEGTFVEDLLDSTVAGANVHAGFEIPVDRSVRFYTDARWEVAGDVQFGAIRAGLQIMFRDPAPGERGGS